MWSYIGASVQGTSHKRTGSPCQDAHVIGCKYFGHGPVFWSVVADGAGSAPMGGVGADIATASLSSRITRYLSAFDGDMLPITEDIVVKWVERTRFSLLDAACFNGRPIRDYACTLLGAIVGSERALFFQIGDGAIVVEQDMLTASSAHAVVFWPFEAEYANVTTFLTQSDFTDYLQIRLVEYAPSRLALFTDGIQRLCLEFASRTVHEPFFAPMFQQLAQTEPGYSSSLSSALFRFLNSNPVNSRTDDDKSLVLAVRQPDTSTPLSDHLYAKGI